MKQSLFAIVMFMLIACGQASAQTSEQSFLAKRSIMYSPFVKGDDTPLSSAKVADAALQKFRKDYKDAKDVEWVEVPDGYRVYFLQDAVLTVADYTKKGRLYSVIRYGEDLLSPYTKMNLEKTFDDFEIIQVAEVKMAAFASKVYIVVMEDSRSVKTVEIIDDEMSVMQEVQK